MNKDVIGLVVSAGSVCIAVYAALVARAAVHRQLRAQSWAINHDLLARASAILIQNPELLQLHGLRPEELVQDGISIDEFNYTYLQMDASSAFYQIGGGPVKLTEFRRNFLRSPQVQKIWKKYLRGRMFSPGPFSDAIDAYILENPAPEHPGLMNKTQPFQSAGSSQA